MGKPSHPQLCFREDVCASFAGVEGRLDLIAVCLSEGRSQVFLFSLLSLGVPMLTQEWFTSALAWYELGDFHRFVAQI